MLSFKSPCLRPIQRSKLSSSRYVSWHALSHGSVMNDLSMLMNSGPGFVISFHSYFSLILHAFNDTNHCSRVFQNIVSRHLCFKDDNGTMTCPSKDLNRFLSKSLTRPPESQSPLMRMSQLHHSSVFVSSLQQCVQSKRRHCSPESRERCTRRARSLSLPECMGRSRPKRTGPKRRSSNIHAHMLRLLHLPSRKQIFAFFDVCDMTSSQRCCKW